MKTFIVYDSDGRILRTGTCQDNDFAKQAKAKEFVMEGTANDVTQKIVDGRVMNRTAEEMPKPTFPAQVPARITNEQWQDVLCRLRNLENNK